MKPEQRMWTALNNAIGPLWHAQRHEDLVAKGLPDVSFGLAQVQGWIELKYLERWPNELRLAVKIRHFTPMQKVWLLVRGRTGGRCWLLLKVGEREWLLFHHEDVKNIGTSLNQLELRRLARKIWHTVPNKFEFLQAVTELSPITFGLPYDQRDIK